MRAVILVGGLGSRLRPFTDLLPKPLLPVGPASVVEILIRQLAEAGCTQVYLATYQGSRHFREYSPLYTIPGVRVELSEEPIPLGTCGPVKLLEDQLTHPFLLINGDVLTRLDLRKAYDHACQLDAPLTAVTTRIQTPFAFGRVLSDQHYIREVQEKPDISFEILAGIYVLKPEIFPLIPKNTYFGIDTLIHSLLAKGLPVGRFLNEEFWLDIGCPENYEKAQGAYSKYFQHPPQEPPPGPEIVS